MPFELVYPRVVPARRPEGHQPAAPRFSLRWAKPHLTLVSVYFAMQKKEATWVEKKDFFALIRAMLGEEFAADATEIMQCTDESGVDNAIVVAYWTDVTTYARWMATSGFRDWFNAEDRLHGDAGYWYEAIVVPYDRHETIYSGPNYRIGFGRTEGSEIVAITNNGFFGAARDRLPLSAVDELLISGDGQLKDNGIEDGFGKHLMAYIPHNTTILRSGQYWEGAGEEQLNDYEQALQPKLMKGMAYLVDAREKTGCMSMRIMTNLNEDGSLRAETSVCAAFASMVQLESWAKSHETHADIYKHAIAMNRLYKEKREVITWHELFVLPIGNTFEYVNCHRNTGILRYASTVEISVL